MRLLSFSNKISFYLGHLGRSYSSDRYSVCGKRPLAIATMNVKLPPSKNGDHNSESSSTIDRVITPFIQWVRVWFGNCFVFSLGGDISEDSLAPYWASKPSQTRCSLCLIWHFTLDLWTSFYFTSPVKNEIPDSFTANQWRWTCVFRNDYHT